MRAWSGGIRKRSISKDKGAKKQKNFFQQKLSHPKTAFEGYSFPSKQLQDGIKDQNDVNNSLIKDSKKTLTSFKVLTGKRIPEKMKSKESMKVSNEMGLPLELHQTQHRISDKDKDVLDVLQEIYKQLRDNSNQITLISKELQEIKELLNVTSSR